MLFNKGDVVHQKQECLVWSMSKSEVEGPAFQPWFFWLESHLNFEQGRLVQVRWQVYPYTTTTKNFHHSFLIWKQKLSDEDNAKLVLEAATRYHATYVWQVHSSYLGAFLHAASTQIWFCVELFLHFQKHGSEVLVQSRNGVKFSQSFRECINILLLAGFQQVLKKRRRTVVYSVLSLEKITCFRVH